jgi:Response regulator of the LytR/AlgR family
MNIAIFDKNERLQKMMTHVIKREYEIIDDKLTIQCFNDIKELLLSDDKKYFNVIFVDVQQAGMKTLIQLRKNNPSSYIIFMSENDDYVFDAFHIGASEYLFKPFDEQALIKAFLDSVHWYYHFDIKFLIPIKSTKRKRFFSVDEIKYVETYYNDIDIVTVDDEHIITHVKNRYRIRQVLKPRWFLQVNQSTLVNMKYVDFLTDRNIILKTREVFPLSRKKLIESHLKFEKFLKGKDGGK